eukprot:CAMPEP_0182421556 /NCGR_PEP_ID=MMETSP1167-20130531/6964_1 /TAXON_ID=2988 /ORGANISM="Mallomonas Sp, Strain CCMP3275" /LENGTH=205 /DNA_ID=CAMNT_0024598805 /DNA_START=364 /DNA_END=981 /DNA_ORIENTATION=-
MTVLPELREVDFCSWAGMKHKDVAEQFPDDFTCWKERPELLCLGSERRYVVNELFDQVKAAWQQIGNEIHSMEEKKVERGPTQPEGKEGKVVLIVCHGGTARALLATAAGLDVSSFRVGDVQVPNCASFQLVVDAILSSYGNERENERERERNINSQLEAYVRRIHPSPSLSSSFQTLLELHGQGVREREREKETVSVVDNSSAL